MPNIIDSIQISGTVYTIQGSGGSGSPTLEVTQAEYDALVTAGTVSPNTYYIITDATPIDMTQYWTSAQTQSAINQATSGLTDRLGEDEEVTAAALNDLNEAVSGKQDTLIAGDNITISGNVISADGGGSITIDPSLDSGSTNAVANSAITTAINAISGAVPTTYISSIQQDSDNGYERFYRFSTPSNYNYFILRNAKINGRQVLNSGYSTAVNQFSLVETSAITTSVTSSSTDAQVPSAKAVNDKLGGLSLVKLTQAEYDALSPDYDNNTLYVIT